MKAPFEARGYVTPLLVICQTGLNACDPMTKAKGDGLTRIWVLVPLMTKDPLLGVLLRCIVDPHLHSNLLHTEVQMPHKQTAIHYKKVSLSYNSEL
jgi:hypothetical protein